MREKSKIILKSVNSRQRASVHREQHMTWIVDTHMACLILDIENLRFRIHRKMENTSLTDHLSSYVTYDALSFGSNFHFFLVVFCCTKCWQQIKVRSSSTKRSCGKTKKWWKKNCVHPLSTCHINIIIIIIRYYVLLMYILDFDDDMWYMLHSFPLGMTYSPLSEQHLGLLQIGFGPRIRKSDDVTEPCSHALLLLQISAISVILFLIYFIFRAKYRITSNYIQYD